MKIGNICIDILPLSWMCLFCDNILVHRYLLISWKDLFMKPLMDVLDYPYMHDKSVINALWCLFTAITLERLHTDLLTEYKKVRPVLNWTQIGDAHIMFNLYQAESLVCRTDFTLRFSQY